jgi:hypothetical protein
MNFAYPLMLCLSFMEALPIILLEYGDIDGTSFCSCKHSTGVLKERLYEVSSPDFHRMIFLAVAKTLDTRVFW